MKSNMFKWLAVGTFVAAVFGITVSQTPTLAKSSISNTITINQSKVSDDATFAIQSAIDKVTQNGGGKVNITAGTYHVKYLDLRSNLNFHLAQGAKIVFSDKFSDFPAVDTRYEGTEIKMHHPDVYGNHVQNTEITGSGTLDGNGKAWWDMYNTAKNGPLKNASSTPFQYSRPFLIAFDYSSHVKVTGITVTNSPAWTIHPLESSDVTIQGVTIDNPLDSPNTDGIDPESSNNVKIFNNTISDGDDCIAIKSGTEAVGQKSPSQNIVITNNLMQHGHGGVVFGSEMSGGITNVVISNNIFDQTDRGIRMKTRRGRGGQITNVSVSNIIMHGVLTPLAINEFYGKSGSTSDNYLATAAQPVNDGTPAIKNVTLSDITATDVSSVAGFVYGLPESPVSGLTLSNYSVTMAPNAIPQEPEMIDNSQAYADSGFWMENTTGVHMNNVTVNGSTTGMFVHNINNPGLTQTN